MALTPQLAQGPRLGSIPLPERGPSIAEAAATIPQALANANARDRQVDAREAQIAHEIALREQADRRSTQVSQGIVAMEEGRVAFERRRDDLRKTGDLTGYRGEADKAWGEWSAEFLAALPADPEVRQHFTAPLARMGATFARDDDAWLGGQKAGLDAQALTQLANSHAVAAMGGYKDAAAIEERRKTFVEFLDTKRLDPNRRALALDAYEKAVRSSVIDGAENAGDVAAMRAFGADASFITVLGKDYADTVNDRAGAVERAQAVQARAAAAAAEEKAGEAMAALSQTIEIGGTVAQKDAEAAIAAARAAKVPEDRIIAFQGKLATQSINKAFGPAADPDGSRTRAELMSLNRTAQQRELTSDESIRHQRLTALQGKRRADDAALLKPMANKTAQGDLTVLGELRGRSRDERFAVAEEVRPGLGYIGLLDGATRQAALEGYYDLKANPDLIKTKGKNGGLTDPTKAAFRAHLGVTAGQMPESAVESYRGVANAIYAKLQKDGGQSGWDARLYAHAVNKAMGARKGDDGVWRGGIGLVGNRHVWLPDWGSARDVEAMIARNPFANATYDGTRAVDKRDVMANFTPVLDAGGGPGEPAYYVFINAAGQELKRKGTRESYRFMLVPGAR
ncbi:hypothetical protein M9978_08365 [Sphingomonas sp. MG17]|uniref:Uncharacterized protein n=1 Tax=Sphingomonas tagetis TaxID=2949092 RepID=A0A9X2HG09_9SPHN|nr:hypothetical protein [Sphingomonas tagetis]MCP3730441.1 hypothetical protein [Sphingomonas tagetis]